MKYSSSFTIRLAPQQTGAIGSHGCLLPAERIGVGVFEQSTFEQSTFEQIFGWDLKRSVIGGRPGE